MPTVQGLSVNCNSFHWLKTVLVFEENCAISNFCQYLDKSTKNIAHVTAVITAKELCVRESIYNKSCPSKFQKLHNKDGRNKDHLV